MGPSHILTFIKTNITKQKRQNGVAQQHFDFQTKNTITPNAKGQTETRLIPITNISFQKKRSKMMKTKPTKTSSQNNISLSEKLNNSKPERPNRNTTYSNNKYVLFQ